MLKIELIKYIEQKEDPNFSVKLTIFKTAA
jgi:hypothetical protein